MMQATTILKEEHDVIERVLSMLEQVVGQLRGGAAFPQEFADWSIDFFRTFADACHHHKEEEALFPLLVERGIPLENGPVGVMLFEHTQGRELIRRMDEAAHEAPPNVANYISAATQYAALLRQHIWKENNVLFTMADRVLTPADDTLLLQAYRGSACEADDRAAHKQMVAAVDRWERELAAAR